MTTDPARLPRPLTQPVTDRARLPRPLTELVRQLLAENGQADADAGQDVLAEGGADAQAVQEVVEAVAEDDHPGDHGDLAGHPGAAPQHQLVVVVVVTVRFLEGQRGSGGDWRSARS